MLHLVSMSDESITAEIMQEVENLHRSIRECCPEIVSSKFLDMDMGPGDGMNDLIEHRIKLLAGRSEIPKDTPET